MLSAGFVYSKSKEIKGNTKRETNMEELIETVSCLKEMVKTVQELLYLEVLSSSYLRKYRKILKAKDILSI